MLRALASLTLRALAAILTVAAALVLHLPTRVGRAAVRDLAAMILPGAVPGHLRIGRVDALTPREIRVSDVSYRDDRDDPVVDGATVIVRPAWRLLPAILSGAPFPAVEVHARRAWTRAPYLAPKPVVAGAPAEPPARGAPISLPSIRVDVDELVGAVPNVELAGRAAHVDLGLRLDGDVTTVDLRDVRATVAAMGLGDEVVRARARVVSRAAGPAGPASVALDAALSLRGASVDCELDARLDAARRLDARARRCALSAAALDRLTNAPPGGSRRLALRVDEATVAGPLDGELEVRATAAANAERVDLAGRVSATHQVADVTVHHLSLDRVAPAAPASDLDGTVHLEHLADGDAHELTVDTARLVAAVADVPVPPARLRARVAGTRVTVRELSSPDVGLSAHGDVDLATGDTDFHAEADLETRELARYPWVRGRASGALRAHLEADGRGGRITARVRGDAQRLRVAGLTVRDAAFQATATHERARGRAGATQVAAAVTARGLQVRGAVGPADLTVRAEGDPFGRLHATVAADGAGLLAALGPPPPGASGPTSARAELDLDLSDASHVRARVARSTLRLRGAEARVTGDLAVLGGGATGRVRVEAVGHGALDVSVRGRRVAAQLAAFDLRWFRPFLAALPADLEGVVDGTVDVDPANLRSARASLRIRGGRQRAVGGFDGTVELTPAGGVTTLRAALDTSRGTRVEADVQAAVPARTGDLDAWVAGVRGGRVALTRVDLGAYADLLPLGVGARGTLSASVDLTRAAPGAPLSVAARVDGRELTAGLRVLSRFFPVVDPLALRGAACFTLRRASLDDVPARVRVALGPSRRGDAPEAPPDCEGAAPLLGRAWAAVEGSVTGPWLSGLQRAARDVAAPGRDLSADARARLRAAAADLRATVGPLRRGEWPLHVPAARVGSESLRYLRPPDLPPDASVSLTATARGALLSLGADVEGEFRTSALRQAGLTDPLVARVALGARPAEGGTALGPLSFLANAMIEVAPDAPPEGRSEVAVDIRAHGAGAALLEQGAAAVSLDLFDVDSRNVLLERFAWARDRGVRGALALHLRHTDDEATPLEASATVAGLRAQMTGDDRRESRPVNVGLRARLVSRGRGAGWSLHSCVEASAREARADCDPLSTLAPEQPGSLRASLSLPVDGELLAPRPRAERAALTLHARGFRLETFTPLVRSESIAGVGGALDASLRWQGGGDAPLDGTIRVSEGHADIIALGERLRGLEVSLRAAGTGVRVERAGFVLGTGRADIEGTVDLAGLLAPRPDGAPAPPPSAELADVRLQAVARALPVGVEGNTYGWVDGNVDFGMRFARDGARGELSLHHTQVRLKEEQTRELQPLGQDGDVFILGRTVLNAVPSAAPYPMALAIDLSDPVLLRRSDLSVAIHGQVQASRERAGWGVAGTIESPPAQGWFSVLGKRFELDRLRVVLDGSVAIDPQLDIAAHHNDVTGDRLTATVGGRLRAPRMEFASVNNPGLSQAEVLAMIALGRRDSQGATASGDLGQQMGAAFASLVGAMTFGTISRGLRFVPTLVLEPGQGSSGRYGAGVSLGPRFYVQLTYGAASSASGQSGSGPATQVFRGLVEFAISQAWSASASVSSGGASTSTSGGVDVFWSP
ncbi:MAG: translocation/assembly module TamB domain-containing protein [Polyangiales bacterium]